eukprot:GHVQ01017269.1.p1 GENE.GHVQ01017269.1~~GHVQ01017269.1.p1  ORF type:complete len:530 (+),score=43.06 GHVQ01017269.1:1488-3077(+)
MTTNDYSETALSVTCRRYPQLGAFEVYVHTQKTVTGSPCPLTSSKKSLFSKISTSRWPSASRLADAVMRYLVNCLGEAPSPTVPRSPNPSYDVPSPAPRVAQSSRIRDKPISRDYRETAGSWTRRTAGSIQSKVVPAAGQCSLSHSSELATTNIRKRACHRDSIRCSSVSRKSAPAPHQCLYLDVTPGGLSLALASVSSHTDSSRSLSTRLPSPSAATVTSLTPVPPPPTLSAFAASGLRSCSAVGADPAAISILDGTRGSSVSSLESSPDCSGSVHSTSCTTLVSSSDSTEPLIDSTQSSDDCSQKCYAADANRMHTAYCNGLYLLPRTGEAKEELTDVGKVDRLHNTNSEERSTPQVENTDVAEKSILSARPSARSLGHPEAGSTDHEETASMPDKGQSKNREWELQRICDSSTEGQEIKHPLLVPSKTYELYLPVGTRKSQRLTYENCSKEVKAFVFKSSHPDEMVLRESAVEIAAASKVRFPLKFSAVPDSRQKDFYLYAYSAADTTNLMLDCIIFHIHAESNSG